MIILDTDVVSALMRTAPEPVVVTWLDRQPSESIWITTVTLFEALFGIGLLPAGRRRKDLQASFDGLVREDLESRILDFDGAAAIAAAQLAATRQRRGRTVGFRDTFIAGIAISRKATLATRNARDFDDLSVPVVDPWRA